MDLQEMPWVISDKAGPDGVSIIHFNSKNLLKGEGISVTDITGNIEEKYGLISEDEKNMIIPEISSKNPLNKNLYFNSFNPYYPKKEWISNFKEQKSKIKHKLEQIIIENKHMPLIVHNILSLREYHPATALSLEEIIKNNPDLIVISYAPDSSFERLERINRMNNYAIEEIFSKTKYLGPFNYDNLYHIVVNKWQEKTFIKKYKIPKNKIFRIRDFLEFESPTPQLNLDVNLDFIEFLSNKGVYLEGRDIKYKNVDIDEYTTFFLCPVRPVERKNIKETIILAKQYELKNKKRTAVVVTHPNEYEGGIYFKECISLAEKIDQPLLYLGDNFKLAKNKNDMNNYTLDEIYFNFSSLKTIATVLSSKGAWENAINECIKYNIIVYANPKLPSFMEFKELGLMVHGFNINKIKLITNDTELIKRPVYIPELNNTIEEINAYTENKYLKRKEVINNYLAGYNSISTQAIKPIFLGMLEKISNLKYK